MASTRILTSINKLKAPASSSFLFLNRLNPAAATVSATATVADRGFARNLFSSIRPDEVIRQQTTYQSLFGTSTSNDDDRFRIDVRGERVVIDDGEDFLGDSEDDEVESDSDLDSDDVYDRHHLDEDDEDEDDEENK